MVETGDQERLSSGGGVTILPKRYDENDKSAMNGSCIRSYGDSDIAVQRPLQLNLEVGEEGDELPSPIIAGPAPPDRGCRAWLVMMGSFLCNGIIFGTINSGGVIFRELLQIFEEDGISNPASVASITLSLAIGTTFFLSMIAGVLTDKLGIRTTTIVGGAIATLGMFLSSIYYTRSSILIVTMGLIFGTGASLAYTPSLVILGHYFSKRLGFVNGFVTAGSSVFTIVITQLLKFVIEKRGLKVAFQILSGLMSILMVCGFVFKPILPDVTTPKDPLETSRKKNCGRKVREFLGQFINFEIWKNKKFVVWTLAIPSALFGYFVPYVHLVKYVKNVLGEDANSEVLVMCIGLTSGVGRIFFGFIADRPWVNRIVLQQISFFGIGILTMLLTVANNFWVFVVISLGMGLFDGCFISLLGPIAFDIVGPNGASQAIGCLLALCAIPLTLGPFIAGVMYDHFGSYFIPFLCAGIPPILGCFALCFIRCIDEPPKNNIGSPSREMEELKNNETSAVSQVAPETQALMTENENNFLQVDVRRLVNLQRESSV